MPLKVKLSGILENKKGLSFRLNLLHLSAGKEGHISNFSAQDLETVLDFIDRYKVEIESLNESA